MFWASSRTEGVTAPTTLSHCSFTKKRNMEIFMKFLFDTFWYRNREPLCWQGCQSTLEGIWLHPGIDANCQPNKRSLRWDKWVHTRHRGLGSTSASLKQQCQESWRNVDVRGKRTPMHLLQISTSSLSLNYSHLRIITKCLLVSRNDTKGSLQAHSQ